MSKPRHRLRRLNLKTVTLVTALLVAALVAWASIGIYQTVTTQRTTEVQRDGAAAQAVSLAEQIKQACASGDLAGAVCQQAVEVAADPVPVEPPPQGAEGPRGPGPTPEQIRLAVEAYLVSNPPPAGRAPSTAEIAQAVSSYLISNPPAPARPPTAGEIADAVQVFYANNPPPSGRDGEPGRPPTAEEIRAAVDAALAENPPPAGATGDAGPQGVGVQSVTTEDRPEGCFLVFTLVDPANPTTPTTQDVPVADGVCDDLP